MDGSNIVVVSTFRRPLQTRLCLESIARAQRWSGRSYAKRGLLGRWADRILIGMPVNWHEHPLVRQVVHTVIEDNRDIPFEIVEEACESDPHVLSKWLLDYAFSAGADIAVYVEDDVVLSPDAFLLCEYTKRLELAETDGEGNPSPCAIGCCCYHETIPAQYAAERRIPDPALVHMGNGINTCGGTAFLRDPYLRLLSPQWNCKQAEPKGFDYSAHWLMYLHGLFMLWPDYSRSGGTGCYGGSLSEAQWGAHFAKSVQTDDRTALRDWRDFRMSRDPNERRIVQETWMDAELALRQEAR